MYLEHGKKKDLKHDIYTIVLTVLAILVFICLSAIFILMTPPCKSGVLYSEKIEKSVQSDAISIQGLSELHFKIGEKDSEIVNQEFNYLNPVTNDCYMDITLSVKDGDRVFTIKRIEPGYAVSEIDARKLDSGVYDCTFQVQCFSMDDGTELNNVTMDVKLYVR